jgi:hypothetical protein
LFVADALLVGSVAPGEFVLEALGCVANFGNGGAIMRLSATNATSAAMPMTNESAASGVDRLGCDESDIRAKSATPSDARQSG